MTQTEITLLQQGIALAKSGQPEEARAVFLDVTDRNPGNEVAWLWLGQIADTVNAKISYFTRALSINPDREPVRLALRDLLMEEGIKCAKSGVKVQAHRHLSEVVFLDPTCEAGWLWLATVETEQAETIRYLENVVALNGQNLRAKEWLNRIKPPTRELPVLPELPPPPPPAPAAELTEKAFEISNLIRTPPLGVTTYGETPPADSVLKRTIEDAEAAEKGRSGEHSFSPEQYRSQAPAPRAEIQPEEKPIRGLVLTVDDSLIIRRAIASTLQKEGYQVIEAEDGMNALKLLNNCLPDVILLDIAMPMMDGYEVCRLIRKNPILKSIPVVMLSGKDGFFDKVKGKMAGSTQYLTKPFQPALLIATVEKYRRPESPSTPSSATKSAWGLA